jgi:hypothetical protein
MQKLHIALCETKEVNMEKHINHFRDTKKKVRLIDADALKAKFPVIEKIAEDLWYGAAIRVAIDRTPTIDAAEVVHGRWERCGGDLHSSGYAVYCSVCNKTHFVHNEYSLGGLYGHKELFELPNYCPNCGADMRCNENG